jgi:hypothetical protein
VGSWGSARSRGRARLTGEAETKVVLPPGPPEPLSLTFNFTLRAGHSPVAVQLVTFDISFSETGSWAPSVRFVKHGRMGQRRNGQSRALRYQALRILLRIARQK